MVIIMMST